MLFVGTCHIGSHRWCPLYRAMQEDDTLKRSDTDPLSDGALKCMFYTNLKSPNSDRVTFSIANSAGRQRLSLNRRIHERTIETFICKK